MAWTRTVFGVAGTTVSTVFPDTYVGDLQIKGARPWVDVRAYGVKGDGTTDDTTNLQSAITAATGGALFIPKNTYIVSDQLELISNLVVYGNGATLKLKNSTPMASKSLVSITDKDDVWIYDLILDGNKANNATSQAFGFAIQGARRLSMVGCQANNFPGSDAAGTTAGDGLSISNGVNVTAIVNIIGCRFENNVRNGASIIKGTNIKFIGCRFAGTTGTNPGDGVDIEPSGTDNIDFVSFIGCEFEACEKGLQLSGDATATLKDVFVTGCYFRSNRTFGFTAQRGDSIFISGCGGRSNVSGLYQITGTAKVEFK